MRVGGFDESRGGALSIESGSYIPILRALIEQEFPGVQVSGAPELTPAYLDTLDVLVISAILCDGGPGCALAPLSSAEQDALYAFVQSGGTALIFSENYDFVPANQSVIDPFGLVVDGQLGGGVVCEVANPEASPGTSGPFGLVTEFDTFYPGWFPRLGASAIARGVFAGSGETGLAIITPDALNAGSGLVVLVSDTSGVYDGFRTEGMTRLVLNTIAHADACFPDCNADGSLTVADFGCFQTRYVLGHAYADCNADGALSVADFGCFQTRFVLGCD
ncbi:MAG: hypothetical protein ACKVU4_05125 [Phycisphaerales bacterium]